MRELLLATGSPFLVEKFNIGLSLDHFVIGNKIKEPVLSLTYHGAHTVSNAWQVGSYKVTKFRGQLQPVTYYGKRMPWPKNNDYYYSGNNRALYKQLIGFADLDEVVNNGKQKLVVKTYHPLFS